MGFLGFLIVLVGLGVVWMSIVDLQRPVPKWLDTPQKVQSARSWDYGVIVVGAVFAVLGVWMIATTSAIRPSRLSAGSSYSSAYSEPSPVEAWTVCQQEVNKRLVSPASAKYPFRTVSEFVTKEKSRTFRVENYVDSQNGFGAMVRTSFTCVVSHAGGDQWIVESLDIQK